MHTDDLNNIYADDFEHISHKIERVISRLEAVADEIDNILTELDVLKDYVGGC